MNTTLDNSNEHLVEFLSGLANQIQKGDISNDCLQKISEFYINYLAYVDKQEVIETEDEEFLKFFTMGWYVYKQILRNKPI